MFPISMCIDGNQNNNLTDRYIEIGNTDNYDGGV